jgi:thiol-disulfide isomerase/thioredoxin
MNLKIVMIIAACLVFLPVYSAGGADSMPGFSLPSAVDGKTISSDKFKGKVLLVTFFATWCPPCRQEIPALIKLQKELGPRGFSVLGLSMDEKGPSVVAKLISKEKINYPVLMANSGTTRDFGGIIGIPTSFLVNRQGEMIKRYPGYVPHALLEKDIKSIL